ncbi:RNA-directed DNA polymerase from mobile element jockey-like [Elysia marginata]|uniref:RNA-directed DNA polymerase from mobile element jockey-like n=1 Tax=Elysia marginata TaxID=1093978 RepID=A0AAV4H3B4_9GAST|nr:RNA-directed DNA polymerase from mobile element jockey-like [Elysia marginata]
MNRINPIIDKHLDDTQLGFRKGKGTRDGIFLLRNTCERLMDCQKDLNLCFIDYAKAFDRVNHEKLMEVLAKAGIQSHAISEKSGILINVVNINNIRYANDTVILAESEEQLQAMLDRIVEKCTECGMAKKTKTMHIRRDTQTRTITVGNAGVEQVSKYSYLGHMITENVATFKERGKRKEQRTGKAKKELDGRCKGMVRVDKIWRYEAEGRKQRKMDRHDCLRTKDGT